MRDKKIGILLFIFSIFFILGFVINSISETVLINKNFTFVKGKIIHNKCKGKNKSSTYYFEVNGQKYYNKIPHCLKLNSIVNVAFDSLDLKINKLLKINNSYYFYPRNVDIVKNKSNFSLEWVY